MDLWKYFAIGHTDHDFMNPMSGSKFDEMIELLKLSADARILDVGCGKAELLVRAAKRYQCHGVGVELSPLTIAEARKAVCAAGLGERIELVQSGGAQYEAAPESFDLACCIGASWIWQGHVGSLQALAAATKPGGLVLVGEPYWKPGAPSDEYLAVSEFQRDSIGTFHSNADAGAEAGLVHLYSIASNEDDWDRYEGLQWNAGERYAHAHPDDPDNEELLEKMRSYRESYLAGGRAELGWALYLFLKS